MDVEYNDAFSLNETELMEYYNFKGIFGKFRLRLFVLKNWMLHSLSYFSPHSGFAIKMQKSRGVIIGKNCHLCPYVQIDLIYPHLVNIEDNVTLGSNCMIFAHTNPTANLFFKKGPYPRKVEPVIIRSGAVITPGAIIMAGVTIGQNSIVSPGSVVSQDVPEYSVVVGNPARVVKKIDH